MNRGARQIGDERVLALVEAMEERMARMEKELADQKKKATDRNRQWWKVRLSELEGIIKVTHNAARFERDEIIHGADVLDDHQALSYGDRSDNQDQFTTASKGFEKAYGLELGSITYDKLSEAPEGVINMLDFRGSLTFLDWFSKYQTEAAAIAQQCDLAVRKWLNSIGTSGVPYPEDEVKADYQRVKELYDSVKDQEKWR